MERDMIEKSFTIANKKTGKCLTIESLFPADAPTPDIALVEDDEFTSIKDALEKGDRKPFLNVLHELELQIAKEFLSSYDTDIDLDNAEIKMVYIVEKGRGRFFEAELCSSLPMPEKIEISTQKYLALEKDYNNGGTGIFEFIEAVAKKMYPKEWGVETRK